MPLFRGTRPLKRWRYVAIFCEELMACAATVQVGPARQAFWAILSREDRRVRERTHTLAGRGAVELAPGRRVRDDSTALTPGRLCVRDGGVALDLALREDAGIEALCPHGRGYVWTRKQAGIPACGTVALDGGPPRAIEALAVVDDTAGYHARVTEWRWAAGVGVDPSGIPLAFNLVEGVNDPPTEAGRHSPPTDSGDTRFAESGRHAPSARIPASASIPESTSIPVSAGSERAVWVAGEPHEVAAVHFAADLSRIESADGSRLRFTAEAQRSRHENLLLVRSDYRAPFGTFAGTLPGGVEMAHGMGVVEHHRARW
jgi:hypothetical protein